MWKNFIFFTGLHIFFLNKNYVRVLIRLLLLLLSDNLINGKKKKNTSLLAKKCSVYPKFHTNKVKNILLQKLRQVRVCYKIELFLE